MHNYLDPKLMDNVIQLALGIIEGHKKKMFNLKASLDKDLQGIPHLDVASLDFKEEWENLPSQTFSGEGKFKMLERTPEHLVLYYQIKAGSHFIHHSVSTAFTLQVCYGIVSCTVSKNELKKGATSEAEANRLHQLCFPEDTGMIITFDLR